MENDPRADGVSEHVPFNNLSDIFALASTCVLPDGRLDIDKFIELSGASPDSDYTRSLVQTFSDALDVMSRATRAMQGRIMAEREFNGKDVSEL